MQLCCLEVRDILVPIPLYGIYFLPWELLGLFFSPPNFWYSEISWCFVLPCLPWAFHFSGSFQSGDSCPSIMGNSQMSPFMIPCSPLSIPISRTSGIFWIIDPCRVTLWFSFIYFCLFNLFSGNFLDLSSNLFMLHLSCFKLWKFKVASCCFVAFCS